MKFESKKNFSKDVKKLKSILPMIIKYSYNSILIIGILIISINIFRWYGQNFEATQYTSMSISEVHDMGWLTVVILGMVIIRIIFNRYIKVETNTQEDEIK